MKKIIISFFREKRLLFKEQMPEKDSGSSQGMDKNKQQAESNEAKNLVLEKTEQQRTTEAEETAKRLKEEAESIQYQNETVNRLANTEYRLDPKIGSLDQDEMITKFNEFQGSNQIINIMSQPPFAVSESLAIQHVTKIICGDNFLNRNDMVEFSDIFDYFKLQSHHIPEKVKIDGKNYNLLEDSDHLLEAYNKLGKLPPLTTTDRMRLKPDVLKKRIEMEQLVGRIYSEIIRPCLNLLDAISKMRYDVKNNRDYIDLKTAGQRSLEVTETGRVLHAKKAKEIAEKGGNTDQFQLYRGIHHLFNGDPDKKISDWESFLAFATGTDDANEITMTDVNGENFAIDRGQFQRYYNPDAALLTFLNTPGLYEINDEGKKILKQENVAKTVQEYMLKGRESLIIQEIQNGMTKEEVDKKYPKELFQVKSGFDTFFGIDSPQFKAFQLGFLNKKITQLQESTEKAKEVASEHPGLKPLLEAMKKQNIPKAQIEAAKTAFLGTAQLHFYKKEGEALKFDALGFEHGKNFDLGDGYTLGLSIGAEINNDGVSPIGGINLNYQIYKNNQTVITLHNSVSVRFGVSSGINVAHTTKDDITLNASLGANFAPQNLSLGLGFQVGADWEQAIVNDRIDTLEKKVVEEHGLQGIWEKWDQATPEEKGKLIESLPSYQQLKPYIDDGSISKETLVPTFERYITDLKATKVYDQLTDVPTPVGINFGTVQIPLLTSGIGAPLAIIGGIKFNIGNITVFTPTASEQSRILKQISDANTRKQVETYLNNLKEGKEQVAFTENSADIYYKPGSNLGIGIRQSNTEIDFSQLSVSLDAYNKALKPAEIKLIESGNRMELRIDNTIDKDVEIHIDPLLSKELAIVQENGKIYLHGNIDNLIVTRERFEFPLAMAENNANIRDIITIATPKSAEGNRSRQWIEQHEGAYLQKLLGQRDFNKMRGLNHSLEQENIINKVDDATRKKLEDYGKSSDLLKALSPEALKEKSDQIKEMRNALNQITQEEYESYTNFDVNGLPQTKEQSQTTLKARLDAMYENQPRLRRALAKSIHSPEDLLKAIEPHLEQHGLEKINDREKNQALTYLLNKWFARFYKGPDDNRKLRSSIISRRRFTERRYLQEFKTLQENRPELFESNVTPEELAKKFSDDIYLSLTKKLTNPQFDFRKEMFIGDKLETGDIFVSSSHDAKNNPTFAHTLNFEPLENVKNQDFAMGFLDHKNLTVGKTYDLNSSDPTEKTLARLLLNTGSPSPEATGTESNAEQLKLLKSPLALRVLASSAFRFIIESNEYKDNSQEPELNDYQNLTTLLKNPEKNISETSQSTLFRFNRLLKKLRDDQMNGKISQFKTPEGVIVEANFTNTKVTSGAYSKCANASHSIREDGEFRILRPKEKAAGFIEITNDVLDSKVDSLSVSMSLLFGAKVEKSKKTEIKKDHDDGPDRPTDREDDVKKDHTGGVSRKPQEQTQNPTPTENNNNSEPPTPPTEGLGGLGRA